MPVSTIRWLIRPALLLALTAAVPVQPVAMAQGFPPSSRPFFFPRPVGGVVLLEADDGHFGHEIWRTDGTTRGTFLLADVCPGRCDHVLLSPRAAGPDLAFFVASDVPADRWRLWRTDGTTGGTFPVARGRSDAAFAIPNAPVALPAAGRLFFFADPPSTGPEPWLSDGTVDGTLPVDLRPGPEGSQPGFIVAGRGRALFVADDGTHGHEPWVSDGTAEGTRMVADLSPGDGSSNPEILHDLGDRILFTGFRPGDGRSLWAVDGPGDDPQLLAPLPFPALSAGGDAGHLYLLHSGDLWISDGTPEGTRRLLDGSLSAGSIFHQFVLAISTGRVVFNWRRGDSGREPWVSDGTPEGTRPLGDLCPGPCSSRPTTSGLDFLAHRGSAFFFADDGSHGWEPWVSDGTPGGTRRLADACPGACDGVPRRNHDFHAAGEDVYFVAGPEGQRRLWRSDGTPAGTAAVTAGVHNALVGLTAAPIPGHFLLSMTDDRRGRELWITDGTDAGTRLVRDINAGGPEDPPLPPPYPCIADSETLCLSDGRFQVRAEWADPRSGTEGHAGARPFPGSDRTGVFWFFHPDNVELIVKQLDGSALNGFYWTFYGALSDVEFWIEVVDHATGSHRTFHNPPREICGRAETAAFPAASAADAGSAGRAASVEGASELKLLDGRFRVGVEWRDPRTGATGTGTAIPDTDRTGYFWFFRRDNVELVVKVLDGRPVNGRFWVFYGALTDVEVDLTVTDTLTSTVARYHNPAGEVCGGADTAAF